MVAIDVETSVLREAFSIGIVILMSFNVDDFRVSCESVEGLMDFVDEIVIGDESISYAAFQRTINPLEGRHVVADDCDW